MGRSRQEPRGSGAVPSRSQGGTLAGLLFPLLWVLFTQTLLDLFLIRSKVMEAKTKKKNRENQRITILSVVIIIFFNTKLTIFQCQFRFYFILFFSVYFPSHRVKALWNIRFMFLCPSLSLPVSLRCVFAFPSSLRVMDLPSVPSVLHLCQGLTLLVSVMPSCSSSLSLFHVSCQSLWFITLPNLYFVHITNTCGTVWNYTVQRLQQLNMQQSNATPMPSTPSSGHLPQFSFEEEASA